MRNATDTREKKGNLRRINHAFRLLSSLREAVEAVLEEGEESDGGCERAEKVLSRLRAIAIGKDVDFSFDDAAEVSPIQKRKNENYLFIPGYFGCVRRLRLGHPGIPSGRRGGGGDIQMHSGHLQTQHSRISSHVTLNTLPKRPTFPSSKT